MERSAGAGVILAAVLWLAACGGNVVVDGERGGRGGDGAGGSIGAGSQGGAGSCEAIQCDGNSLDCSCKSVCPGEVLRADCEMNESNTVICECHLDGSYLGTCGQISGSACTLPNGCCTEYL